MLGNTLKGAQSGPMRSKLRPAAIWLTATLALFAANCSKPVAGEKELLGKIKGKASLRLADGSTISQPGTDEYNPFLVKLSDGYLALVYGSNQGGVHNLYVTKSLTAFDGEFIPFFNSPLTIQPSGSPMNLGSKISFAAKASGTSVVVYISNGSNISSGTFDPTAPTSGSLTNMSSPAAAASHTIVGISGDGSKLLTTDLSGIGYVFAPGDTTATAFGYGLDNATSATQVRQENSGYEDAILGVYFSSTYAAAGAQYFGPVIDLDTSLAFSGLSITSISTFSADSPANDIVLFSAFDFFEGFTEDLYVITSHTSKDLWDGAGFPGFDFFPSNPPPMPDHHYAFESGPWGGCSAGTAIDFGSPAPWAAGDCSNITFSSPSYNLTEYGIFNGTNANLNLGTQSLQNIFTVSAWVYIPPSASLSCATNCPIISNGNASTAYNGFRFYVNAVDMSLHFLSGDGSSDAGATTGAAVILDANWHHVAAVVNASLGGSSYVNIYVDGIDVTADNYATGNFTGGTAVRIGTDNDGTSFFDGNLDDVMMFDAELTPAEVAALAAAF